MKALLGLSGFLIGPKASTISHQKKKCIKKCPFWNPHFRAEIWCLTAWSAGKALVQKILVGNWKYCIKASIRRFYFFNRPNSGREKCNSIFELPKVTKNDKFCTKKVVVKLPCMIYLPLDYVIVSRCDFLFVFTLTMFFNNEDAQKNSL